MPEIAMEILVCVHFQEIGKEERNTNDHMHRLIRMGKGKVILEDLILMPGITLSCSAELVQEKSDMSDVDAKLFQ